MLPAATTATSSRWQMGTGPVPGQVHAQSQAESEGSQGREQGWGAVHRGPPSTQSLLSTGCCRHISLPAEMMGR